VLLVALCWLSAVGIVAGQERLRGIVVDSTGGAVAGARVAVRGPVPAVRSTAADGQFEFVSVTLPLTLEVSAPGFTETVVAVEPGTTMLRILLQPRGISESLTVSASGGRRISTPASVTVLDAGALASAPAATLDDQLRSVPGFSLFRRSSSRVANPTTQGVTLRGMAASGASRAAVLADGAPLTDPFGGWVHWMRIPSAAIDRVEVARGGASDMFGADAIGGAIRVDLARAGVRLLAEGGQQGTARLSLFAGAGALRGGAERFTTDGFVTVAPEDRGPIDVPASSHHTSVFGGARLPAQNASHVDLRGGYVTERRGNGTPFQTNSTTVRHGAATMAREFGAGILSVRLSGASQDYDQAFSAVAPDRASERPTTAQRVDTGSAGLAVDWLQPWRSATVLVAASGREVRGEIVERSFLAVPTEPSVTEATERSGAVAAQLSHPLRSRLTLSAGARGEGWRTVRAGASARTRVSVSPRASLAYQATGAVTLRAALQSGYRFPTLNELFRDFRVGAVVTTANPDLRPEHSLGLEGAALLRRGGFTARAAAFWARVDDAIVNVTLTSPPPAILRQRRNAARIAARGLEMEADLRATRAVTVTAALAWIDSTFGESPELDGRRVPQVPRLQASAGVRGAWRAVTLAAEWRHNGEQFEDDRNRFVLDPATMVDARAGVRVARGLEFFVAVENVFDEEQDVGRTPLRTIGMPRSARVGLRLLR
jgi:outer membrane receptor protein involved in Fe transport